MTIRIVKKKSSGGGGGGGGGGGSANRNNGIVVPSFLQPQRGFRFSLLVLLALNVTLWLVLTNVGLKNFLFGPAAVNIQQQKQKRTDDTDSRVIVKGKETFIVHSTTNVNTSSHTDSRVIVKGKETFIVHSTTNVNTSSHTDSRVIVKGKETFIVHSTTNVNTSSHIVEGNKTYGIIHVAKTGGTALNERMARKYERVCGNKGASFQKWEGPRLGKSLFLSDAMDDVGYLDCDVIIMEKRWTFWQERFSDWFFEVELHVPCRDPIETVMSRCNMNEIQFECPSMELSDEEFNKGLISSLEKCYLDKKGKPDYRVSLKLKDIPNFQLKCFDYKQEFNKYWEYMDARLQRKRIETLPNYVSPTWGSRNRSAECVWRGLEEGIAFRNRMTKFMIEEYPDDTWRFCETCLGSQDDLLAVV